MFKHLITLSLYRQSNYKLKNIYHGNNKMGFGPNALRSSV